MDSTLPTRPAVPVGCPLSKTEYAVLIALAHGKTYQQVADDRHRSVNTIRTQMHDAYKKLGVSKLAHALIVAGRQGWLRYGMERRRKPRPELALFTRAYLQQFDRWVDSRWTDDEARAGMKVALAGMTLGHNLAGHNDAKYNDPSMYLLLTAPISQ